MLPRKSISIRSIKRSLPTSLSFGAGRGAVFVLLIALFLSSCLKNTTTPINSDVKAAFNYQPGTYWVYKDSLSGQVDSFMVQTNTAQNTAVLNESIFMNIARYNVTYDTDTAVTRSMLSLNYFQTYVLGTIVTYPFAVGALNSGAVVLSTDGTYTVNGEIFNNVAVVSRIVQTNIIYADTFYINADAGIIKINEYQKTDTPLLHRVWELQRRNILR